MYKATVLIISKRRELSIKYKKMIKNLNHEVFVTASLAEAINQIRQTEPELILVSDTIEENLAEFCKKIRVLTFNFRPVIVAVSKSSEMADKLEILEAGADDFLSESTPTIEFQARINAHLRRSIENFVNPLTSFVKTDLTVKAIEKNILNSKSFAVMLLDIFQLNSYKEIYGEIAHEKVLQTISAIIKSVLGASDFAGHFTEDKFIILTSPLKAEKFASFLTFAFDNILERFYSENDFKNKFIIFSDDNKTENKIPLMKLDIAVLEAEKERFKSYKEILNSLGNILKLCEKVENSAYLIDRPKLKGKTETRVGDSVLIFEKDEALSYLLKTSCEIRKIKAEICDEPENFLKLFAKTKPKVVILDYGGEKEKEGIDICLKIKKIKNTDVKIIFSSSIHNKKEILSAGADFYLPKPYDINLLMSRLQKFAD